LGQNVLMDRFFYQADVLKIVDGDTLDLMVDVGFDIHHKIRVRLYGVNTPESRTSDLEEKKLGLKAKDFTLDWVKESETIFIQTIKDKTEKYGRILARIYSNEKMEKCLNDDLISSGNAVEYFGGKR